MFDSEQYEWADVTLVFGGRDVMGIRGIKYSEEIEREPLFAKGRHAHSIQSGNVTVKGEIKCLQSELEALILSGKGSILNLKGGVATITYGDPVAGDLLITDAISGLYFTTSEKELNQGDKFMEVTLPFVATRVQHQV